MNDHTRHLLKAMVVHDDFVMLERVTAEAGIITTSDKTRFTPFCRVLKAGPKVVKVKAGDLIAIDLVKFNEARDPKNRTVSFAIDLGGNTTVGFIREEDIAGSIALSDVPKNYQSKEPLL